MHRERRMGWKSWSFQIIAGILSKQGVLFAFMDFTAACSSAMVNGSVEMFSCSTSGVNGNTEPPLGAGGGCPRSFSKWDFQFSKRFGEEPPLIVMEDLLFLPVNWFMVFQAAACFFSL